MSEACFKSPPVRGIVAGSAKVWVLCLYHDSACLFHEVVHCHVDVTLKASTRIALSYMPHCSSMCSPCPCAGA